MSNVPFRNVDADAAETVDSWPLEDLRAALERGNLEDYRRIVAALEAEPWGAAARRVEQVLEWSQPYGVARLMHRAIARSRLTAVERERAWVRERLHAAVDGSGLSRREFAQRLGTSASRLSTYLGGSVVPSATVLARADDVSRRARRS